MNIYTVVRILTMNPIYVATIAKEKERLEAAKGSHLPIHVTCILDEHSDYNDPILHQIRDHCIKCSVLFTSRIYDSYKYSCDRDFIERLPAFHIYIKRAYIKTYYPNTRPLQHVNETIELYQNQLDATRIRKHTWVKWYISVKKWFKALGHRKTRMELHAEEQSVEWKPGSNRWIDGSFDASKAINKTSY